MIKVDSKMSAYYRRASSVLKLVRFAVLLGFVVFAVFCIGFFKDNITVDNLRYLLKYLDLSAADNTPSDAEITLDNGSGVSYVLVGNDLAVLGKNGIGLYDFAGNKLYQYDMQLASPAVLSNGKNLLVYDTDGKDLAVFDAVSKVLEKHFDYDVKSASLNGLGSFAVITSEKTYRSGVVVFDRDGKETFRWMSPDKYLTGTALNANATVVTCAALSNKNGAFTTELVSYNTATGAKEVSKTFEDTLVLKLGYAENDSYLYMLTDSAFVCFDRDLNEVGRASYNPENARFFRAFDECFLIAESNNLSGSSMTVRAYGYDAAPLFECSCEQGILDAEYRDRTLYLLERDRLSVYDYGTEEAVLTPLASTPLGMQYRAVRADAYGRYVLIGAKNAKRNSLAALLQDNLSKDTEDTGNPKENSPKEEISVRPDNEPIGETEPSADENVKNTEDIPNPESPEISPPESSDASDDSQNTQNAKDVTP